jgi:hypothetical protein
MKRIQKAKQGGMLIVQDFDAHAMGLIPNY